MSTNFCPTTSNAGECAPRFIEKLLTGVVLLLALGATVAALPAHSAETPASKPSRATKNTLTATSMTSSSSQTLPNGTYLYGQVTKAEQIGKTYMVFQVRDRQVVGAFYMPSSSFDCVHGTFQPNQLALTVVNSDEQTSYPYSVPLQSRTSMARSQSSDAVPVGLAGFHRIPTLSSNDQRILSTCQANYQASLQR